MTDVWHFLALAVLMRETISLNIGNQCIEQNTRTVGRCTLATQCQSAREDYQSNGIRPTYCSDKLHEGVPLVCCRDGTSILQTEIINENRYDHNDDRRRVAERKCDEYSQSVVQTVGFIPLVPDPEQMTISAPKCDYTGVELVVGGEDANQGEFPHMAAVGWVDVDENYSFQCGGSLISSRFVLTAGHCTYNPRERQAEPTVVRLGEQNLDSSVQDYANPVDVLIKAIHKHPDYKAPSKYNDIALLELVTDVDFSNDIRPACLWSKTALDGIYKAIATGWGVVDPSTRKAAKNLQKVSLSLFNNSHCNFLLRNEEKRHWKNGVISTQMCAGELRGGKDTCQGDSGSPLQVVSNDNQCIFLVIGVTSFGRRCGEPGKPAVYTRVSKYLDWIESIVWPGE